jgi:hypothetical protein
MFSARLTQPLGRIWEIPMLWPREFVIIETVVRGDEERSSLRQTCDKNTDKLEVIGGNRWTHWRLQPVTNVNKPYYP